MILPQTGVDPRFIAMPAQSQRRIRPSFVIAVVMLLCVAALILLVPLLPGYDPMQQNLMQSMKPPFQDRANLLGTDPLGRDLLSRLSVAARISVLVAFGAVIISAAIGMLMGLLAGWTRGLLEKVLMAVGNTQLSIPVILLLIVLVASLGSSVTLHLLLIGLTNWVS